MTLNNVIKYWDNTLEKAVAVTPDTPLPTKLQPGKLDSVEAIPDPSSATAEEVATAFNALLVALKGG